MGGGLLVGGGEFAELRDGSGDGLECAIDFGLGGVTAETETDAGASIFGGESDSSEDVRRFDGAGRARSAGGDGNSFKVEGNDKRFAFDSGKREICSVESARRVRRVDVRVGNAQSKTLFEFVAKRADARSV